MSTDCEFCGGDGHSACDTCLETGIGQHGDPDTSKCHDCGGKGYTVCSCVEEERQAHADFERKRRIEDRLIEDMERGDGEHA